MSKTTLIKASGIERYYGNFHAVKNLDFELHKGDILGFLGPNGAGKSTTMQIISGCLAPDAGQIQINGFDLTDEPTQAKQQLGYLPELPPLYKELTVDEYLSYTAKLRKIPKTEISQSLEKSKSRCGLTSVGNKLISNLSKGYQQRVGIAQAIIHNPAVIILDEPTVGLDPIQIQEIRQLIIELGKDHGVILSTHILPEVQAVCNRVQIIRQGELVYHSDMQTLTDSMSSQQTELCFKNSIDISLLDETKNFWHIDKATETNYLAEFTGNEEDTDEALNLLLKSIVDNKLQLVSMSPKTQSLEQIFIDLTVNENQSDKLIKTEADA